MPRKLLGQGSSDKPIPGTTHLESLATEEGSLESEPTDYNVKIEGSDIVAVPQTDGLSKVTDTDIGPLLEELVVNQLPPVGSLKEATGKISLGRGEYPGDLSNGTYDGVPLPAQCHIIGQQASHYDGGTASTIPTETPATRLNFTSRGFFSPNEDNDFTIYPRLSELQISGDDSEGSIALDLTGSNPIDWAHFSRLVLDHCEVPVDTGAALGRVDFWNCQALRFSGTLKLDAERKIWHSGAIHTGNSGLVLVRKGQITDATDITGVADQSNIATVREGGSITDCRIRKDGGGTQGEGTAINMRLDAAKVQDNIFSIPQDNDGFQFAINVADGEGHVITGNVEKTTGTSYSVYVKSDATDVRVSGNDFKNGILDSGTRTRFEGIIEMSGAPSESNYSNSDVGTEILDTSASPPDKYLVLSDGSLTSAY